MNRGFTGRGSGAADSVDASGNNGEAEADPEGAQERALTDRFGGLRHREQNGNVTRGASERESAFRAADDMLLRGHRDWQAMRQVRKACFKIILKADGTPAAVVARRQALEGFAGAARVFFQRG